MQAEKKKERRKVDRFNVKRREHVNKSKERNCINVITTQCDVFHIDRKFIVKRESIEDKYNKEKKKKKRSISTYDSIS